MYHTNASKEVSTNMYGTSACNVKVGIFFEVGVFFKVDVNQ